MSTGTHILCLATPPHPPFLNPSHINTYTIGPYVAAKLVSDVPYMLAPLAFSAALYGTAGTLFESVSDRVCIYIG